MTLRSFVGTYTRSADNKGRVIFPKQWEENLIDGGQFYLYKAPQLDFVALVTEGHVQRYYIHFLESTISPLEVGSDSTHEQIAKIKKLESLVGWGPQKVNISERKGNLGMRLQIPAEGHFRSWLTTSNNITMVGTHDYIAMYLGDFESVAKMLGRKQ